MKSIIRVHIVYLRLCKGEWWWRELRPQSESAFKRNGDRRYPANARRLETPHPAQPTCTTNTTTDQLPLHLPRIAGRREYGDARKRPRRLVPESLEIRQESIRSPDAPNHSGKVTAQRTNGGRAGRRARSAGQHRSHGCAVLGRIYKA